MKVCIVGATGVLGRALVPLLLERNDSVRGLARFTREQQPVFPSEVESVPFDLLSMDARRRLPSLLESCDAVVHAATQIPSDFSVPGAWDLNTRLRTEGTLRLTGAAIEAGIRIYIQQSITMAYPDMGERWIEEEEPLDTSPSRSLVCAPVIGMENTARSFQPQPPRISEEDEPSTLSDPGNEQGAGHELGERIRRQCWSPLRRYFQIRNQPSANVLPG